MMYLLPVTWLLLVTFSTECVSLHVTDIKAAYYMKGTVYIDAETGEVSYRPGVMDRVNGTAYGYYNNTLNETGWSVLEIRTRRGAVAMNNKLMFAAGYLEGVLTARQIWQNYVNMRADFVVVDNTTLRKLKNFYAEQDKWTRSMIKNHPSDEDAYWRHVAYIRAQFDGLYAGYRAAALPEWDSDRFVIEMLNGIGDFIDLKFVLHRHLRPDFQHMTLEEMKQYITLNGHCSALVKVTAGFENLFMSHNSWFLYAATMRIFKHYHFYVKDLDTAATSMSFSSYAGYIESLDDFYELSSGLLMLQTTNNIFDTRLYDLVTPRSLFAWQRVRVANMMAHSGQEWYNIVRMYNSGTYNNQYMIVDLKKVTLGRELANGTLWVIEQIPGLVVGADQTTILRAGYWPSYNIPFYPVIFNMSGYPQMVDNYGPLLSYELSSRAKIFRRDQGTVVDIRSMQALMRYNDYKNDRYSEGDPCSTICCRGDLMNPPKLRGCYDAKVTDVAMALNMTTLMISGPTTSHGLPPFSWTPPFDKMSHVGFPTSYNFDWVHTQPLL